MWKLERFLLGAHLNNVIALIRKVAPTDANVFIRGETGTGKELIAHAIHRLSARKDQHLVTVHCSTIPEPLISSALFGHEKGSFTGAYTRQIGRFELAHKGTMFLDEVGDIPVETQVKLLRVLQEGQYERIGSPTTINANTRVIASTNRDIGKCIKEGSFRSDFYYRLNVFPISVPPLRERKGDIPLLAWHFCQHYARHFGKNIQEMSKKTITTLTDYSWPGNVRELENVIERGVILCEGPVLSLDSSVFETLDLMVSDQQPVSLVGHAVSLATHEREYIKAVLEKTGWVVKGPAGAANLLELKPSTLYSKMKKFGISKPSLRVNIAS